MTETTKPRTDTMPRSAVSDTTGRNYGPPSIWKERLRSSTGAILIGISGLTLAAVIANESEYRPFDQQIEEEIRKDGFEADVNPNDLTTVDLMIGSTCMIKGVEITVEQRGNDIQDVTHYEVPLEARPMPLTARLEFADREDLGAKTSPVDVCELPGIMQASR